MQRWKVDIIESERGWGQRIDQTIYFDSKDQADQYVKKYNAKNNKKVVPNWYMYADTPEQVTE